MCIQTTHEQNLSSSQIQHYHPDNLSSLVTSIPHPKISSTIQVSTTPMKHFHPHQPNPKPLIWNTTVPMTTTHPPPTWNLNHLSPSSLALKESLIDLNYVSQSDAISFNTRIITAHKPPLAPRVHAATQDREMIQPTDMKNSNGSVDTLAREVH